MNIGKSVSNGFRWGKIIEEVGTMVKVRWDGDKNEVTGWMCYRNFEIPEGFD
jgi:hypothetical protein